MTPAPKIATIPMGREYAGCPPAARGGFVAAATARHPCRAAAPVGQPVVASERRKKVRLAGRSAIRRTR